MKWYAFRFWVANALIVFALSLITVVLYGCLFPMVPQVSSTVFQGLSIIVSILALLFALLEAVFLYRNWKASMTGYRE